MKRISRWTSASLFAMMCIPCAACANIWGFDDLRVDNASLDGGETDGTLGKGGALSDSGQGSGDSLNKDANDDADVGLDGADNSGDDSVSPTADGGCPAGFTACAGECIDSKSDNSNCGGCGSAFACRVGATCQSGVCTGGGSDAEARQEASCTNVDLPPSVNVDATQWSFDSSPNWNCTASGTTTITASTTGASIGGDTCGGSATLDFSNNVAQTTGGPNVLVIRLKGLTVTSSHIVQLAGDEPVIFLVNGNVAIDAAGTIDASANGTTAGPGGNGSVCGTSTGKGSMATSTGGGGGGFGTAGGYGADQNGNSGSAGGAVAASLNLRPLRGGCAGGSGANGTNPAGGGGGAFEISASGTISVGATGTAYLSAAGGFSPGATTSVPSNGSGGAGSGGGVLLVSPAAATFAHGSVVRVHGGGSGSGRGLSSTANAGQNGSTTTNTPAAGGAAPDTGGAAGAAGGLCAGTGTTCSPSQAGSNGTNTVVSPPDGSGGGGGGGSVQVVSASATTVCK
jgi:hypothetical protein